MVMTEKFSETQKTARQETAKSKARLESMGEIRIPERDEDRRRVFEKMLGITRTIGNRFTAQELEDICLKRGYLLEQSAEKQRVKEKQGEKK